MKNKKIFLCGFMTSGKSTIGPILANVLGWKFYDLDKVIEAKEGKPVVQIFEDRGEEYFRELERKTLKEIALEDNVVIALGGGTIANEENLTFVKSIGTLVYLKTSREMIYKRIRNKIDRPAFRDFVLEGKSEEEFSAKIEEMLSKREPFYLTADLVIDTDKSRVGITVDVLAKKIRGMIDEKD